MPQKEKEESAMPLNSQFSYKRLFCFLILLALGFHLKCHKSGERESQLLNSILQTRSAKMPQKEKEESAMPLNSQFSYKRLFCFLILLALGFHLKCHKSGERESQLLNSILQTRSAKMPQKEKEESAMPLNSQFSYKRLFCFLILLALGFHLKCHKSGERESQLLNSILQTRSAKRPQKRKEESAMPLNSQFSHNMIE